MEFDSEFPLTTSPPPPIAIEVDGNLTAPKCDPVDEEHKIRLQDTSKRGKPRDSIWQCFTKSLQTNGKTVQKCNECGTAVSAQAQRLKAHYSNCRLRKHNFDTTTPTVTRNFENEDTNNPDVMELQLRIDELEQEVGSLRGELRLLNRKFRTLDPYRHAYEEVIESTLLRVLDNECYWKMVRINPHKPRPSGVTDFNNSKQSSTRPYPTSTSIRKSDNETRFRSQKDEESGSENDQNEEEDPLALSTNSFMGENSRSAEDDESFTSIADDAGSRSFSSTTKDRARRTSNNIPRPHVFKTEAEATSSLSTRELRLKVYKRAREIGERAVEREFNLSEGRIRNWQREDARRRQLRRNLSSQVSTSLQKKPLSKRIPVEEKKRVIDEVKKYPILWSAEYKQKYKSVSAHIEAWNKVSKALELDVPRCKRAWKGVRDGLRYQLRVKGSLKGGDFEGEEDVEGAESSAEFEESNNKSFSWDLCEELSFLLETPENRRITQDEDDDSDF